MYLPRNRGLTRIVPSEKLRACCWVDLLPLCEISGVHLRDFFYILVGRQGVEFFPYPRCIASDLPWICAVDREREKEKYFAGTLLCENRAEIIDEPAIVIIGLLIIIVTVAVFDGFGLVSIGWDRECGVTDNVD